MRFARAGCLSCHRGPMCPSQQASHSSKQLPTSVSLRGEEQFFPADFASLREESATKETCPKLQAATDLNLEAFWSDVGAECSVC